MQNNFSILDLPDLPNPLISGIKTPIQSPTPLPPTPSNRATEDTAVSSEPFLGPSAALPQLSSATLTAQSASPQPASSASNLFSPPASPGIVGSPTTPTRRKRAPAKSTAKSPYTRPYTRQTRKPKAKSQLGPGQGMFQLDPSVTPFVPPPAPSEPLESQPIPPKRRAVEKYADCKCPDGLTSKPSRHWRCCPSNPENGQKIYACAICGARFGRNDNMTKHVRRFH